MEWCCPSSARSCHPGGPPIRLVYSATSGADGNFSISGLPSEASLPPTISHSDYQLTLTIDGLTFSTPYSHDLTSNVTGIDLTAPTASPSLARSFTVALTGPGSGPIAGADVTIPEATCDQSVQLAPGFAATNSFSIGGDDTTTDASGTVTLDTFACPGGISLSSGNTPYIHIQPPAGSGFAEEYVPMPTSWSGNVTVPVSDASAVQYSGVVEDPSGSPVAGVPVNLTDANGNPYSTTTGSDGSFSFILDPGTYNVDIKTSVPAVGETITGSVVLSTSQTGQVLALPALDPLDWVVTDASGTPLSGASVSVTPSAGSCTAQGDLPPGLTASLQPGTAGLNTDGTGTATLLVAPCSGITYSAQISASGYVTQSASPLTITGPTSATDALAAAPPTALTFSGAYTWYISLNHTSVAENNSIYQVRDGVRVPCA